MSSTAVIVLSETLAAPPEMLDLMVLSAACASVAFVSVLVVTSAATICEQVGGVPPCTTVVEVAQAKVVGAAPAPPPIMI